MGTDTDFKHLNTSSKGSTGSAREEDIAIAISWFSLPIIGSSHLHTLGSAFLGSVLNLVYYKIHPVSFCELKRSL